MGKGRVSAWGGTYGPPHRCKPKEGESSGESCAPDPGWWGYPHHQGNIIIQGWPAWWTILPPPHTKHTKPYLIVLRRGIMDDVDEQEEAADDGQTLAPRPTGRVVGGEGVGGGGAGRWGVPIAVTVSQLEPSSTTHPSSPFRAVLPGGQEKRGRGQRLTSAIWGRTPRSPRSCVAARHTGGTIQQHGLEGRGGGGSVARPFPPATPSSSRRLLGCS